MTDSDSDNDEARLDRLFATAKRSEASVNPAFLARLNTDMERHLPQIEARRTPDPARPTYSRWQHWFAASGLASATALGVWIGFIAPDTLNSLAGAISPLDGYDIQAFLPSAGLTALTD